MNVRYQIFLSSTYSDLSKERKAIWEELIKTGFIVVGMEQFPASDEEQMEYIRPLIDDSDYYILVIKGRYGSLAQDGLSYTEKEYLYALEQKKPFLAFLYKEIGNLRVSETDQDPAKQAKLSSFREKLLEKRIVKLWDDAEDLAQEVMRSVFEIVRRKPAKGWIRGDNAADPKIYIELEALRKQNSELSAQLNTDNSFVSLPDRFLHGQDKLAIVYVVKSALAKSTDNKEKSEGEKISEPIVYDTTWDGLLNDLVEVIYKEPREQTIQESICEIIAVRNNVEEKSKVTLQDNAARLCRFQFQALGVINTFVREEEETNWGYAIAGIPMKRKYLCWELTPLGKKYVAQIRAKRRQFSV